jgi:hypothetical protein
LWKSRAPTICCFFLWLALQDRCWMAERRARHGLQSDSTCALCSQEVESISHLLLGCVYSREIWYKVLRRFGWLAVVPTRSTWFALWWTATRRGIAKPRRKAFDSLAILVAWSIWLERNMRLFRRLSLPVSSCIHAILAECESWYCAKIVDRSQLLAL